MIITRTPLRVSLLGGGSDIPNYYNNNKMGFCISLTIDKYIYVVLRNRVDNKLSINYGHTELVNDAREIQHDIIRSCLVDFDIFTNVDIVILSDISFGTGLGSSSSLTVGLLRALYKYKDIQVSKKKLAEHACRIEIDILKKPIGKQDQYAAAYGGFNIFKFTRNNTKIKKISLKEKQIEELVAGFRLFDTKIVRSADHIISSYAKSINQLDNAIAKQVKLALDFSEELEINKDYLNLDNLSFYLNKSWEIKKQYSDKITNPKVEEYINHLYNSGVNSLKLLGAGGGGMILFLANINSETNLYNHERVNKIKFEPRGSIVVNL
jgi:D-glycero-alpha-D-manno-heptose-7-phosphate kinase